MSFRLTVLRIRWSLARRIIAPIPRVRWRLRRLWLACDRGVGAIARMKGRDRQGRRRLCRTRLLHRKSCVHRSACRRFWQGRVRRDGARCNLLLDGSEAFQPRRCKWCVHCLWTLWSRDIPVAALTRQRRRGWDSRRSRAVRLRVHTPRQPRRRCTRVHTHDVHHAGSTRRGATT